MLEVLISVVAVDIGGPEYVYEYIRRRQNMSKVKDAIHWKPSSKIDLLVPQDTPGEVLGSVIRTIAFGPAKSSNNPTQALSQLSSRKEKLKRVSKV